MRIANDLQVPVRLLGMRPEMVLAAGIVDGVFMLYAQQDACITSVTDGVHQRKSLHAKGYAMDFRTRGLSETQKPLIANECSNYLGPEFDVVLETDHLHVEWDPDR